MKRYLFFLASLAFINSCQTKDQPSSTEATESVEIIAKDTVIVQAEGEIISPQNVLDKRVVGEFTLVASSFNSGGSKMLLLELKDNTGKVSDKLEFVKEGGAAASCDTQSFTRSLSFESNNVLKTVVSNYELRCPPEHEMDQTDEEYLIMLQAVEDPKDISGYETNEDRVSYYSISEEGKFIEQEDRRSTEIKNFKYVNLSLFDNIPKDRLRILRNTIFAQYGLRFKSEDLQAYFSDKNWYEPKLDNVDNLLTAEDKKITNYIKKLEEK